MGDIKKAILKDPLPYAIQAGAFVMLILNLYLAAQLSPVIKDLAVLKTQVQANEAQVNLIMNPIVDRLDRIEIKLDKLIDKK